MELKGHILNEHLYQVDLGAIQQQIKLIATIKCVLFFKQQSVQLKGLL